MNRRIAKKICKNKGRLNYSDTQIARAERIMLEVEMEKHIKKIRKEGKQIW